MWNAPTLTSFHHIMSPGMLGTQTYSQSVTYSVPWNIQKFDDYLDSYQAYCNVFGKKFQTIIVFVEQSFYDHLRYLTGFKIRLYIYKCYLACTVILGSIAGIFRHIQALFKSVLRTLCIPGKFKPWNILIAKHIQTLRYIHNIILNIFTKALSWTFDTVLNASLFSRVTLWCL